MARGSMPLEFVQEIASGSEDEISSILVAPRELSVEAPRRSVSWFLVHGRRQARATVAEPVLMTAAELALMRQLVQLYRLFDESRDNPEPSPLGHPFDSGVDVLLGSECFWPEAHQSERWQWLSELAGVVSLQLPEGGFIRFEYAYTPLVQVEDRVLTDRMLQQHGLPLAPDRAAVLLRPLDCLKSLRFGIMWYVETAYYTEAFNRGCNEALQLVQCSWCPGHRCARVTLRSNAHTAPEGAHYC